MFFVLYHSDSRISNFSKLFWLCLTKFESLCFPEVWIFRRSKVDDDVGNAKDRELVLWVSPRRCTVASAGGTVLSITAVFGEVEAARLELFLLLKQKKYRYAKLPSSNYNRPAFLVGSVKALYLLKGKYSDSKFSGKTQSR